MVEDDFYGSSVEIAQTGATLLTYSVKSPSGPISIIDGFQTEEELVNGSGYRSWVLAPFSNKLLNNAYTFDGQEYSISSESQIIHGFVHNKQFEIDNIAVEENCARISFSLSNLGIFTPEFYPFEIRLQVIYTFSGNKLKIEITGSNFGNTSAPLALGWHPYFKIANLPVESYIMTIPADRIVMTDATLFPYHKEMAYTHISNLPGSDFRKIMYIKKRMLGKRQLNVCYSHLQSSPDGRILSSLEQQDVNSAIYIRQNRGVVYCYTGDDLSIRPRQSVSIQSTEFITNAFNRADLLDKIRLEPGSKRSFEVEIEVK